MLLYFLGFLTCLFNSRIYLQSYDCSSCITYCLAVFIISGQALTELSREKPSQKQVENHTNHYLKTLETVENGLAKHIAELTQVSTSKDIIHLNS